MAQTEFENSLQLPAPIDHSRSQITLLDALLVITLVSMAFAVFWVVPGLTVVLISIGVPVTVRVNILARQARAAGEALGLSGSLIALAGSMMLTLTALAAGFAAYLLVFVPAGVVTKSLLSVPMIDAIVVSIALGAAAGCLTLGYVHWHWWDVPNVLLRRVERTQTL